MTRTISGARRIENNKYSRVCCIFKTYFQSYIHVCAMNEQRSSSDIEQSGMHNERQPDSVNSDVAYCWLWFILDSDQWHRICVSMFRVCG